MAGGGFASNGGGAVDFEAKITPIVIISCIMAATGGLMFGYDVGVSGNHSLLIPRLYLFLSHMHLYVVVFHSYTTYSQPHVPNHDLPSYPPIFLILPNIIFLCKGTFHNLFIGFPVFN